MLIDCRPALSLVRRFDFLSRSLWRWRGQTRLQRLLRRCHGVHCGGESTGTRPGERRHQWVGIHSVRLFFQAHRFRRRHQPTRFRSPVSQPVLSMQPGNPIQCIGLPTVRETLGPTNLKAAFLPPPGMRHALSLQAVGARPSPNCRGQGGATDGLPHRGLRVRANRLGTASRELIPLRPVRESSPGE